MGHLAKYSPLPTHGLFRFVFILFEPKYPVSLLGLSTFKNHNNPLAYSLIREQTSLKLGLSPKRDYTSLPLEIGIVLLRFTYVVEIIKKYNVILFLTL